MQRGTGQNGPKGGQQAIYMCFETVLDHLDTILVHFQPKREIEKKFEILTIWGHFWPPFGPPLAHFGPFLDPQKASGAPKCRGEPAKMGQKGVNRP